MEAGARWLCGLVLVGCAGGPQPEQEPTREVPAGWGQLITEQPDEVLAMLTADESGWAALHRGELVSAVGASAVVAARAQRDLHATEAVLLKLHTVAAVELAKTWADRAGLPEGTALHTWAALAAADQGQPTAELLALAPAPHAQGWAALHKALADHSDLPTLASQVPGPLGDCLAAHAQSRAQGVALAENACPDAFLVEADGARSFADPLAMRTRHLGQDLEPLPETELSSVLFSAAWGAQDLADPSGGPTARRLGLDQADTAEDALVQVQAATAVLDAWRPGDDAPGARLSADLDVMGVYRAHLLTDWALTRVSTPVASHEALRALLDADAGLELGPTHPPRMLAAEALSAVRAGHVRSALPSLRALEPLSLILRELPALTELVNDLQVVTTLGRGGDSKEP